MTVELLASEATYPPCSNLFFPSVYPPLFRPLDIQQISSLLDVPVCMQTPKSFGTTVPL